MNILSDLKYRNMHKGKDIYVIASGKSIDYLPLDFLEGKITIGVNQVFKKVKCRYYVRKESALLKQIYKNDEGDISKSICFVSRHDGGHKSGNRINKNYNIISKYFPDAPVVIFDTINNIGYGDIKDMNMSGKLIATVSTITTAIHLGAYMGAKNIFLCGHDCCDINGSPNFDGYHTDKTYSIKHKKGKEQYISWLPRIQKQTQQLKKLLKTKYNINVISINPFIGLRGPHEL